MSGRNAPMGPPPLPAASARGVIGAADDAAATGQGGQGHFHPELFAALLESLQPLDVAVRGLAQFAARHLAHHDEITTAIKQRMDLLEAHTPECRAMWLLLDAIFKLVPLVFVPDLAVELDALAASRIPWDDLLRERERDAAGVEQPLWFEAMFASWAAFLAPQRFAALAKRLARERSARELRRELLRADELLQKRRRRDAADGGRSAATAHQLARLEEDWLALHRLVATGVACGDDGGGTHQDGDAAGTSDGIVADSDAGAALGEAGRRVYGGARALAARRSRAEARRKGSSSSDPSDDDDDGGGGGYVPDLVAGATGDIGAWEDGTGKQRRAPRVRRR